MDTPYDFNFNTGYFRIIYVRFLWRLVKFQIENERSLTVELLNGLQKIIYYMPRTFDSQL